MLVVRKGIFMMRMIMDTDFVIYFFDYVFMSPGIVIFIFMM